MGTHKRLFVLLVILAAACLAFAAHLMFHVFAPPRAVWSAQALNGPMLQARRWQELSRTELVNDAFELQTSHGWTAYSHVAANHRVFLEGSYASSEHVAFVIMDAQNWSWYQAGYPPQILYSGGGGIVKAAWPVDGSFYGFIRLAGENAPASLPSSLSGLAAQLVARAAAQNRAPARVTAHLFAVEECLCTDAEAAGQK